MERSSDRWHEVNLSRFVWEREGLDVIRRGLPDVSPIRAWANVEFVSHDGSINEVDLIVLTSAGLFLVELKAWSGRISGDGQQWRWTPPGATNHKFVPNPILATNSKAKKLRSLLNGQPALRGKCPRVEELVFLSSNDLDCQLLQIGRQRVFGRGGAPKRKGGEPLDSILDVLLGRIPVVDRAPLGRITPDEAAAVARAVEQANIRPCMAERRAGDYVLTSKLGEAEELWEDWVGEHTAVRAKRRIRRWLSGVAGNAEYAARLARAANREFTFLAALDHPAIDRPLDYRETEYGPVLVYPYDEAMRPLATWLDEEAPRLTLDVRLDLIRQLAEVLQHAHGRRAYHRALSASVVDVVPGADGPQLRVRDWATGARESEGLPGAVGDVSLTGTVHVGELVADPSRGFLAPETFNGSGDLDPVALDVFALGAVAYLILSGQAPAANAAELRRLLHDHGALDVGAAVDGLHETLAEMVRDATQANPELRCSIGDVLTALDLVAEDLHPPVPAAATEHDEPTAKPTEAGAGDRLAGGWVVKRRLGKGSTAVAYLTEQNGREVVLKVAHEPTHHDRLLGEFEVLQPLDHPAIVRAFDIDEIDGHPALVLASAGDKTLAQRLREDLPDLSLLQRWGEDLLEALEYLEDHGVAHRDVKPENLGVRERRDGKLHLVLFDFSLSRTPADIVHVGTRAYLDPFLDERPSRRWDVHAERWSACVVLYEMATGQRPRWPGGGDPGAMPDVEVELDPATFPEVIAPRLVSFFERAFRRNPRQRFGSMEDLRQAWSAVFADLDDTGTDTVADAESLRERLAAAAPDDALASLDLTPRVLDALSRLQAFTVGDLANVSIPELRKARGIGDRTRRQVVALLQLLPDAAAPASAPAPLEGVQGAYSVDALARVLLPADLDPNSTEARALRALLNLDGTGSAWPSQGDAAGAVGVTRARVSQLVAKARDRWKAITSISQVRQDVVDTLPSLGGVATTAELADTLLAVRGSSAIDPLERQRRSLAALRAAIEAELSLKDKDPRVVERRRGDVVVIADDATGVEGIAAAEWALALGVEADRLVVQDPLPTAGSVLQALRAVELPTGLAAPTDQRLVRLAASCSTGAVASPRLDLHPVAMPPERAVVAARSVLFGPARIGVDAVHERVRARFPGAAALPQRPELDALMARIGMRWVPDHDSPGYGAEHEFARLTTIGPSRTRYSSGHLVDTAEQLAIRDVTARLERQSREGGFCVWSVTPNRLAAAISDIERRCGAVVLDLDRVLLQSMREVATEQDIDWSLVLDADATPGDVDWLNLKVVVDSALPRVVATVLAAGPVVVVHGLGLLARYDENMPSYELWRAHASGERPIPGAALSALWVVVPSDDPDARPRVAGIALTVVGSSQYAAIPNAWIAQPVEAVA